jgi:hypothetical protein
MTDEELLLNNVKISLLEKKIKSLENIIIILEHRLEKHQLKKRKYKHDLEHYKPRIKSMMIDALDKLSEEIRKK